MLNIRKQIHKINVPKGEENQFQDTVYSIKARLVPFLSTCILFEFFNFQHVISG